MVSLWQRFYMLEHDLGKNLNAKVKDDKATMWFCSCCVQLVICISSKALAVFPTPLHRHHSVHKSGLCTTTCSLLLGSTSQLLNPIKYLPFSIKHCSTWLLSLLKMLWKEKRESCIMQHVEKNNSAAFSLMSLNLPRTMQWCTKQCPVASQALQGLEGQVPSLSLFLHRVYGILVSAVQK